MKLSHCFTPATPWPRRGYSSLLRTSKHWGKLNLVKSCTWSIIILKVRTKYSPLWICKLQSHNYLPSSAIRVCLMHLVFNLLKTDFSQRGFPAVHLLHLHKDFSSWFNDNPRLTKPRNSKKDRPQWLQLLDIAGITTTYISDSYLEVAVPRRAPNIMPETDSFSESRAVFCV